MGKRKSRKMKYNKSRRTRKRLNRSTKRTIQRVRKKKYSKRKKKEIKKIKGIRYFQMGGGDISNLEYGETELGSGSIGTVHQGTYKGNPVAIKVFKNVEDYEVALKKHNMIRDIKFKREPMGDEESLCGNIIEGGKIVAGIDSKANNYVMLFEIIQGKNLSRGLRVDYPPTISMSGTLCKKYVVDILKQLLPLHAEGLSHCDLGIQNIMLEPTPGGGDNEYFARVIDFDIAGELWAHADMHTLGSDITKMLEKATEEETDLGRAHKKLMLLLAGNLMNEEKTHRLNAWNTYILLTGENPKSILPENFGGCNQNTDFLEENPELLEKYRFSQLPTQYMTVDGPGPIGIKIYMTQDGKAIEVEAVKPDGKAAIAKIEPGMILLEVNDQTISGMSVDDVTEMYSKPSTYPFKMKFKVPITRG